MFDMTKFLGRLIVLLIPLTLTFSQTWQVDSSAFAGYKSVIPGTEFKAGWLHTILFGKHWRDIWTTSVTVPVLNLKKITGGITPLQDESGFSTVSLRLKGTDGNFLRFRPISKHPEKILPEDFRKMIGSEIIMDQVSSSLPFASLISAHILEAVKIDVEKPIVCILPDDSLLGEFQKDFGGLLGTIEIHPDDDAYDNNCADFKIIKNTYNLMHILEEERSESIDARLFLKARLLDIFLGDWDRRTVQWRWTKHKIRGSEKWYPVPRDKDQVFAKFDGIVPRAAAFFVPQLNHFDEDFPQIEDITWSGRFLDRRYLTALTKSGWDSVTSFIISNLTDSVIELAVRLLPHESYLAAGSELISALKARRDNLADLSEDYFKHINAVVDVYASIKEDYVEVNRLNNLQTEIILYRGDGETGGKSGKPFYYKMCDNFLTDDIRIYLLDGDDKVMISGKVNSSPLIRIIGGKGKDELIDNSEVSGYFAIVTPIPDAENKTIFYDSDKITILKKGTGTLYNDEEINEAKNDFERFEPEGNDRGHDWSFEPIIDYSSDDGVIVGISPMLYKYNFRQIPFEYLLKAGAAYNFKPNSFQISFEGIFNSLVNNSSIKINMVNTRRRLSKFFGYGNETSYNKQRNKLGHYDMEGEYLSVGIDLSYSFTKTFSWVTGLVYNYSDNNLKTTSLLNNFPYGNYGSGSIKLAHVLTGINYDTRDNLNFPKEGMLFNSTFVFYPNILGAKAESQKLTGDIRKYITIKDFTLALRTSGGKIWGTFPFQNSQFVGGEENLRGYRRERFAGDASITGQAELRVRISKIKFIIIGDLGLTFFAEVGRVFVRSESSKKWHPSYGLGSWFSLLEHRLVASCSVGFSSEDNNISFATSMEF